MLEFYIFSRSRKTANLKQLTLVLLLNIVKRPFAAFVAYKQYSALADAYRENYVSVLSIIYE